MPFVHSLAACQSVAQHGRAADVFGMSDLINDDSVAAFAEIEDCEEGTTVRLGLMGPDGLLLDESPEELVPMRTRNLHVSYKFADWQSAPGAHRIQLSLNGVLVRERDFVTYRQKS